MPESILVDDIYCRQPKIIHPTATVRDAVLQMDAIDTNSMLVVDGDRVIGVLSTQDITAAALPPEMRADILLSEAMHGHGFFEREAIKLVDQPVTAVMRTNFLTVAPESHLIAVAAEMEKGDLYVIPVIKADKLLGIVARSEVRAALVRIFENVEG